MAHPVSAARRHRQLPRAVHSWTLRGPRGPDCPSHSAPIDRALGALWCGGVLGWTAIRAVAPKSVVAGSPTVSGRLAATAVLVAAPRRSVQFRQSHGDVGKL